MEYVRFMIINEDSLIISIESHDRYRVPESLIQCQLQIIVLCRVTLKYWHEHW